MKQKTEYESWLSTYGIITAQRILESFETKVSPQTLISLLKQPDSFHHLLVALPSQNLFNGIVRDQARDYQSYSQKKLIDFLLSGQANEDTSGPGESLREQLEQTRVDLVDIGESFDSIDSAHRKLIFTCQDATRETCKQWLTCCRKVEKQVLAILKKEGISLTPRQKKQLRNQIHFQGGMQQALEIGDLCRKLELALSEESVDTLNKLTLDADEAIKQIHVIKEAFMTKAQEVTSSFIHYRNQFKQKVISIKELITQLNTAGYREDEEQDEENRQALNFYDELGEE